MSTPKTKTHENTQDHKKNIERAPRFELTFNESTSAEIKTGEGAPLKSFTIQDISTSGTALFFEDNPTLQIGDFMNIEFKLAGRNYSTLGEIVRKEINQKGHCSVAVSFRLFNWHEQQELEKYLKEKYKSLPSQNKNNFFSRILNLFK